MNRFTNQLSGEKSPYLLQHAHNPVQWHPWSEEAFKKARAENKPVFLSIGYSTCHWCHVMEHESFEDEKTAEILNEHFISIKVDREERPEIDSIYMQYVISVTGRGGWPMSVFITPEQKPFYGGTYFPPADRYGMPGFKTLLLSIVEAWKERRGEIDHSADSAAAYLKDSLESRKKEPQEGRLEAQVFDRALAYYESSFDPEFAGFGTALKFPRSHSLSLLLRVWARNKSASALRIAEETLLAMARGGMYDQIGGGFHRYSTDRQWRVPHFEKMLYDQALLVQTYLEAYQATGKAVYAAVARHTLDYVLREMTSSEGGFFSAQDADSLDPEAGGEKKEGAYFVWSQKQLAQILTPEELEMAFYFYGITDAGNAIEDPQREFVGKNVLYQAKTPQETAAYFKKSPAEIGLILRACSEKILRARRERPAPHLDDKVLMDWNGLMIASFALAGKILREDRYTQAAAKAADFILSAMRSPAGDFFHRYREGEAKIPAGVSDYAFFIEALLELYEATFDPKWLALSVELTDAMVERFWDAEESGFFMTGLHAEALIARPKEVYDGAVPSGNSVAALVLAKLSRITGQKRFEERSQKLWQFMTPQVLREPSQFTQALIAFDFWGTPGEEIVIAADLAEPGWKDFKKEIDSRFLPNKIVILNSGGMPDIKKIVSADLLKDKGKIGSKTAVYVCRDYACQKPVTEVSEFVKILDRRHSDDPRDQNG